MIRRTKRPRGLNSSLFTIMIAIFGMIIVAATWGATMIDSWLPDAGGTDANAWLRAGDAAPGYTVAIRVISM